MAEKKKRAEAVPEMEGVEPEKQPAVEAPTEAQGAAMTVQTFADEVNQIIDRATAAGLRPLPVLATILAKRGMGLLDQTRAGVADVVDRFLASLEGAHAKEEKK